MRVSLLGRHAVRPALSAIALGLAEGLSWEQIDQGLASLRHGVRLVPMAGRMGTTVLDDAYNSSPVSARAALDALDGFSGRRVAILGDMLELGSEEAPGHLEVGRRCSDVVDVLVTVGSRARMIAQGASEMGAAARLSASAIRSFPDNDQAIAHVHEIMRPGDTILVKGSRGMAMEAIVKALREPSHDA
jgi:UDP-N-acetylmuramoyl-tripeptide--D-alanyl-D-alanine ligase